MLENNYSKETINQSNLICAAQAAKRSCQKAFTRKCPLLLDPDVRWAKNCKLSPGQQKQKL